jgi:hypothetical protein
LRPQKIPKPCKGERNRIRRPPTHAHVQEQWLNPLSMNLHEGEFKPSAKITVMVKEGELAFQRTSD